MTRGYPGERSPAAHTEGESEEDRKKERQRKREGRIKTEGEKLRG